MSASSVASATAFVTAASAEASSLSASSRSRMFLEMFRARWSSCDDAGNARLWDATSGPPLSGWVKNGPSLKRAHLSPDGKWALSAAETGTVRVWPVLHAALPAPVWLPELAEALAGRRLREDGTLEQVPAERWLALNKSLAASTADDFYSRWAR